MGGTFVLNKQGFDLWANDYDKTVKVSEESDLYPFAGYKNILNTIYNDVMQKDNSRVLDIGFGTGVLTSRLYENGHQIDGIDFSEKMISIAKDKMPLANLMEWDISNGLPNFVHGKKYDSIVSTYTLHHLSEEDKVTFIKSLLPFLAEDGKIYIGDVAFQTREKLELCKKTSINYWDDDEFYFVYDELNSMLQNICKIEFHPKSHCGAVFILSN